MKLGRALQCCTLAALVLAGGLATVSALADDWTERPYNPPVGSRWIIQRDLFTEQNDEGTISKKTFRITSELKITEKTPTGFRITYARRNSSYESDNTEQQAMIRPALAALQGVEYHASTDAAGKPLRVDNIEDVKAALRGMADSIAKGSGGPEVASVVQQMLAPMLQVDETSAAELYLDQLPALALTQNTGLKLGEIRRDSISQPNPMGKLVINRALEIAEADPATGDVKYVLTESYDPASMQAFLVQLLERLGRTGTDVSEPEKNIKDLVMSLDERTESKVTDGMTRSMIEESTSNADLPGTKRVIKSRKVVTVTPAP